MKAGRFARPFQYSLAGALVVIGRDLMRAHPEYDGYRRQVPMLVPAWPKQ